jgi:hypothetical protein
MRWTDHRRVADLLHLARVPAVNELAVMATAMETWRTHHSTDGGEGQQNPLGRLMFGDRDNVPRDVDVRISRSATAGRVPIPLHGQNTFVVHGAEVWNHSLELREAKTIGEAKRVSRLMAKKLPL